MILPLLLLIFSFLLSFCYALLEEEEMVAHKRERLVFAHRSLGSWEGKHQEENIILCGSILAVTNHERRDRGRKEKELKKLFW